MAKDNTNPNPTPDGTTPPVTAEPTTQAPATSLGSEELGRQEASVRGNLDAVDMDGFTRGAPVRQEVFQKDPDLHYIPVEVPHDGFPESQLGYYRTLESPTKPGTSMYWLASKDPVVTGNIHVVLLACTLTDYRAMLKEGPRKAAALLPKSERMKLPDGQQVVNKSEFTTIENVPLLAPGSAPAAPSHLVG